MYYNITLLQNFNNCTSTRYLCVDGWMDGWMDWKSVRLGWKSVRVVRPSFFHYMYTSIYVLFNGYTKWNDVIFGTVWYI